MPITPYIGELMLFAGNFAPRHWARCEGQLLPISQNQALFSVLGTTYGGNGTTNFALPDLRGRFAIGAGQGPGLASHSLGERAGTPAVTLLSNQLGGHAHGAVGVHGASTPRLSDPNAAVPRSGQESYDSGPPLTTMAADAIVPAGGNQPHENRSPGLGVTYCIALFGAFPPRD